MRPERIEQTHLYREIHEQPAVLQRMLQEADDEARRLAAAIHKRNITHVILAARGTRDNAGR